MFLEGRILVGKVAAIMRATTLAAGERTARHQPGNELHIPEFITGARRF